MGFISSSHTRAGGACARTVGDSDGLVLGEPLGDICTRRCSVRAQYVIAPTRDACDRVKIPFASPVSEVDAAPTLGSSLTNRTRHVGNSPTGKWKVTCWATAKAKHSARCLETSARWLHVRAQCM